MANYSVTNSTAIGGGATQFAISATYQSQIITAASTVSGATIAGQLRRGKLYDILLGTNTAPADNFLEFDVAIATIGATVTNETVGISSLSSNFALDPADGGFVAYAQINSTAQTWVTTVTEKWYLGMNQRASYRWVAAPGSELVFPAVSSGATLNGLTLRARSGAYTGTVTATVLFQEQ